jgi:hypothetical protein
MAVSVAGRQLQIGIPQAKGTTASSFITQYLCPAGFNLINCNNFYVRVEVINLANTTTCKDIYNATTGTLPISGNTLNLASFSSIHGNGSGTTVPSTSCDSGSYAGYCNPLNPVSPPYSKYVILTAIYVAPSFMNGFVPGSRLYTYNGADVRAQIAASSFNTDNFTTSSAPTPCA